MRLLLLFLVAFVPIAALTIRAPLKDREADLSRATSQARLRIELAERTHRELATDGRRILHAIGRIPGVLADTAGCTRLLLLVKGIIEEGWSMSRIRPDGTVDCISNAVESDVRDTFYLQHAREISESDSGIIGPYRMSTGVGAPPEPLSTAYVRLVDNTGANHGALTIRRRLRWLSILAAELGRDSALITVTDATGLVFARYPESANLVGSVLPAALGDTSGRPDVMTDGIREATSADSTPRLFVFTELEATGPQPLFLSLGFPSASITAEVNTQLWRSIAWLIGWIALTFVCALYAAERVVFRDLRALLSATERLGQGDLSARTGIPVHAGELGHMANAFDRMAEQLEERQDRLAQAQKMESVGQLAGGVAHDFNNLLTAIIGNAEIARDQLPLNHPAREDLRHVLDAARRSGQLTRQLLAFAKRNPMDIRVLSLNVLLADVASFLQRIIGEHITLTVECDADLQPTRIDPTQFEQLILNLAVNARDAMPDGGTLKVEVRNVRVHAGDRDAITGVPPGKWVALSVTDTGLGMPPEVMRRAFEPFFTTKGVGEGTGLGLAVVYGTVQQHSGHVAIESAPGKGTTIRILLPPSSAAEEYVRPASPTPIRAPGGRESLLLVEDEAAVRSVSARLLRSNGYDVCEAVDGVDAVEQMRNGRLEDIALLITDVVMPRMGGPDLVQTLRRQRPTLPVLLLCGYSEAGIPQELFLTPGTSFVEKPFTTDALLLTVRRLLDERVEN